MGTIFKTTLQRSGTLLAAGIIAGLLFCSPLSAYAEPTAAEKQAEANAVMARIDEHQTTLNAANENYIRASAEYDAAVAAAEEAQRKMEEESARLEQLQVMLGDCAIAMYKMDGGSTFLSMLLESETVSDVMASWDAIQTISRRDSALVLESKRTRETYEVAKIALEEQSQRAAEQKEAARAAQEEAAAMHDALVSEAERLTAEVAALQAQEEALAEEARKAEEARAAAEAKAAEELQARAEATQALAETAKAATDHAQEEAEAKGIDTTVPVSYTLLGNPCPEATNSSGFGYRDFDKAFHKGLDMSAPEGTPYYAAESGTVVYATNDGGYNGGAGNWIVITHGGGIVTKYMHSSRTLVTAGQHVERGELIGYVGNTGQSFGSHLHFQVEINGDAVNPLNYI